MGLTKPMKTVTFLVRLSPEERDNLHRMAQEREISLAEACREGARLYLEDWKASRGERDGLVGDHVATT